MQIIDPSSEHFANHDVIGVEPGKFWLRNKLAAERFRQMGACFECGTSSASQIDSNMSIRELPVSFRNQRGNTARRLGQLTLELEIFAKCVALEQCRNCISSCDGSLLYEDFFESFGDHTRTHGTKRAAAYRLIDPPIAYGLSPIAY